MNSCALPLRIYPAVPATFTSDQSTLRLRQSTSVLAKRGLFIQSQHFFRCLFDTSKAFRYIWITLRRKIASGGVWGGVCRLFILKTIRNWESVRSTVWLRKTSETYDIRGKKADHAPAALCRVRSKFTRSRRTGNRQLVPSISKKNCRRLQFTGA